jgi:ribosomal protein S18 acetylase RimI-like enzyme
MRQGRGLGSALLEAGLARCDSEGASAYLESSNPKNIPLYERYGFEALGVIEPDDFPPLTPMLRPAR